MAEEMSASAHSSSSGTKPASGCVVLRVKRKREEDPADALAVAKHNKLDAGSSVFHFVGTLKEDASDGVILDRLKHYRDRSDCVKSNPLARLTLEDTKIQTRDRIKANSSAQRFKVTSQLRCLQEECSSDSSGKKGNSAADEERGAAAAASEPAGVNVHICDVNQEDFTLEDLSSEATGPVTCNGSVMVREKVEHKKAGYVYDLYCAQEPEMLNLEAATFDWNSLSVYEPELVHDIIDDMEERYDDEDDSNDENNWRNEYPDEEGPTPSSSSDLDNYGDYRHTRALYSSDEDYRFDDFL